MNIYQIAFNGAGSIAVAYSVWHLGAAIFSDSYRPPRAWLSKRERGSSRLLDLPGGILFFVGCSLIGWQLGHALLWWMPFEWGTDFEGEFQSYRDRFSQLLAAIFALGCIVVPERAYERAFSFDLRMTIDRWRYKQAKRLSHWQTVAALCELGLEASDAQERPKGSR